jgi:hypothetical protein
MQNAEADDAAVPSADRNDSFYLTVSDLVSLIDHVQPSIRLIKAATAQDCAGNQEFVEIVVLDDVTPLYTQAGAALGACNASLSAALRFLLETKPPPARAELA